jgi:hypothetical protein
MEAGFTLFPTWSFLVWREGGVLKVGENAQSVEEYTFNTITERFEYPGKESTMMFGPNIFVGIDYYITQYFDLIFGVRLRAAFGSSAARYWIDHHFMETYTNSIIQLAFEFKFNYYHDF